MASIFKKHPMMRRITRDQWDHKVINMSEKHYPQMFTRNEKTQDKQIFYDVNYTIQKETIKDDGTVVLFPLYNYRSLQSEAKNKGDDFILVEYKYDICMEGCQYNLEWKTWQSNGGYIKIPQSCNHIRTKVMVSEISNYYPTENKWQINKIFIALEIDGNEIYFELEDPWPFGLWKRTSAFQCKIKRIISDMMKLYRWNENKMKLKVDEALKQLDEMNGHLFYKEEIQEHVNSEYKNQCEKFSIENLDLE